MSKIIKLLCVACICALSYAGNSQTFLSTNGKAVVNETGDTVILRGMGLGGWMLQEGYMLKTAAFANPQHEIREKIVEVMGEANTDEFYEAWLTNHCTREDIDSLASWGFNSVRLPMHYNLYTLPIEDEPVPGEQTWLEKGFAMTDSLINWCRANDMYVVLDMHACPGGQNWWANDFTNLTPPWDDNLMYGPHKYWSINDQASIQWVINIRDQHNVPIYFGECGENSNTWFRDAIKLFEDEGMGWAWWMRPYPIVYKLYLDLCMHQTLTWVSLDQPTSIQISQTIKSRLAITLHGIEDGPTEMMAWISRGLLIM